MVTPAAQRNAVAHLMGHHGMSERRACKAIGFCRMTMRYETRRSDDQGLRERMKVLAHERRRFGYRRLHVLLRREGHLVNHKKLFRLYREEKLTVRKRGGRKRAIGTRAPILIPMSACSSMVRRLKSVLTSVPMTIRTFASGVVWSK